MTKHTTVAKFTAVAVSRVNVLQDCDLQPHNYKCSCYWQLCTGLLIVTRHVRRADADGQEGITEAFKNLRLHLLQQNSSHARQADRQPRNQHYARVKFMEAAPSKYMRVASSTVQFQNGQVSYILVRRGAGVHAAAIAVPCSGQQAPSPQPDRQAARAACWTEEAAAHSEESEWLS